MGFLDFLKKKQEIRELTLAQVPGFLEEYWAESGAEDDFSQLVEFIKEQKQRTVEALETLENAELMNKNIPQRAMHILAGNKKIYIQRMNRFLGDIQPPDEIGQIEKFLLEFGENALRLQKDTQKNFMIINEFLRDELRAVVKEAKLIEVQANKFQANLLKYNLDSITSAKKLMSQIKESKESKKLNKKAVDELAKAKQKVEKDHKIIAEKIAELQKSNDMKEFESLNKKLKSIHMKLEDHKRDLNTPFSNLHRALKKYKHGSLDEDLIDKYIEDVWLGLQGDSELKIIGVLGKLKNELDNLDLKNPDKMAQLIGNVTDTFLQRIKEGISTLEQEKALVESELSENSIMEVIAKEQLRFNSAKEEIKTITKTLEEKRHKLSGLSEKKLLDKLNSTLEALNAIVS